MTREQSAVVAGARDAVDLRDVGIGRVVAKPPSSGELGTMNGTQDVV